MSIPLAVSPMKDTHFRGKQLISTSCRTLHLARRTLCVIPVSIVHANWFFGLVGLVQSSIK